MDTSLRIILLLVGIFIIAGIVWDTVRAKRQERERQTKSKQRRVVRVEMEQDVQSDEQDDHVDYPIHEAKADFEGIILEEPEHEIVVLKKTPPKSSPQSPLIQRQTIEDDRVADRVENRVADRAVDRAVDKVAGRSTDRAADRSDISAMPVILNLMAKQGQVFSGKKLVEAFHETYLHFGEMQIFHYHEHPDGTGDIVFSVASAVEPGIFDRFKMDQFVTPGLTFFFMPSRHNLSIAAFEAMLRIAKQMALLLDGELQDDKRLNLTNHSIDRYRDRVRAQA